MAMPKTLHIPLDQFVMEILTDLPMLIAEHPKGITYQVLHEEYGETISRITRAVTLLEEANHVKVFDALPPYILPTDYTPPQSRPYQDLSDLQRRLFQILVSNCQKAGTYKIRTNYAQLSRLLDCSTGGSRSSLDRLATLEYLQILEPSQQGKTNTLLVELNTSKVAVQNTVAHNLDS